MKPFIGAEYYRGWGEIIQRLLFIPVLPLDEARCFLEVGSLLHDYCNLRIPVIVYAQHAAHAHQFIESRWRKLLV